jgi:hypothetical protein
MKKAIAILLVGILLTSGISTTASASGQGRGGLMGFIAGCCFGLRAAGDYNEGKEIHWREWVMLVPYVNIVFAIWNGIDGASGKTRSEYASEYGAVFY